MRRTIISIKLVQEVTHQVVIQIGITLELLIRLLDSIIANYVVFLDTEVRQVECGIAVPVSLEVSLFNNAHLRPCPNSYRGLIPCLSNHL